MAEVGMGKQRCRMRTRFWLAAIALLLPLLAAGCADNSSAADRDKPGGFYTGVSSGAPHP